MASSDGSSERSLKGVELSRPSIAPLLDAANECWQRCLALRPRLAAYLRAMLPDHHAVDDCLQDTFAVLTQRYADATESDLAPIAFTCARNKAHAWLEKNKVGRLSIMDPEILRQIAEAAAQQAAVETSAEYSTRVTALRACLDKLTPEHRQLIEARYGTDRNNSVIALAASAAHKVEALYKKLERLRAALKRCVLEKLAIPQ